MVSALDWTLDKELQQKPQENEKMWGAGGLKAWSPQKGS